MDGLLWLLIFEKAVELVISLDLPSVGLLGAVEWVATDAERLELDALLLEMVLTTGLIGAGLAGITVYAVSRFAPDFVIVILP